MIRIVTESMSDFTQEEAKAADLIVMPLPIRFGMEEYWDDGVSLTQGDYCNLKITTPEDLAVAEALFAWREQQ